MGFIPAYKGYMAMHPFFDASRPSNQSTIGVHSLLGEK